MKQLSLFEESRPYRVPRPETLVMGKDALIRWKQRIFEYQQAARNSEVASALLEELFGTWRLSFVAGTNGFTRL